MKYINFNDWIEYDECINYQYLNNIWVTNQTIFDYIDYLYTDQINSIT